MTVAAVFPGADTILGQAVVGGLVRSPGMAVRSLAPQPDNVVLDERLAEKNVQPVLCVPNKRDTVGAALAGADIVVAALEEAESEAANVPQLETIIDEALMKNAKLFIFFGPWARNGVGSATSEIVKKLQAQNQMAWVGFITGFLMESIVEDKAITQTQDGYHLNVPVVHSDKPMLWTCAEVEIQSAIERVVQAWKGAEGQAATILGHVHLLAGQRATLAELAGLIHEGTGRSVKVVTQPKAPTDEVTAALDTINRGGADTTQKLPPEAMTGLGVQFGSLRRFVQDQVLPTLA